MTMNRREAMAALGGLALSGMAHAQAAPIPEFWKTRLSDIDAAVKSLRKGRARVLAVSPGKRDVHLVTYGEKDALPSTANYNSACGGNDPASFARKDGAQKPVLWLLGPVHGQEIEAIAGLVNLIAILETGKDLRGREWADLSANLAKCRVLIVPCGNPDGRARCPHDSWVGGVPDTHERVGMGTRPDGANYTWPQVKQFHPMRGAVVKTLGAYFNDDGINLMHDNWFEPMAPETKAFLRLAREEAPDYTVSFHSHGSSPSIEPLAYAPRTVKQRIKEIGDRVQKRYAAGGVPHRAGGPAPAEDGEKFPPPSFNLTSALHHVSGGVALVHETCTGLNHPRYPVANHDQLLDIQLLFHDELAKYAVENPVRWTK